MTDNQQQIMESEQYEAGRSLWQDGLRRLFKRKLALICLVIIAIYFGLVCFIYIAEWTHLDLSVLDWTESVGDDYQRPGKETVLGTDIFGQSVFRKTLYGAKISLTVALCASLISMAIGIPLGALAGYCRGIVDDLIVWIYSTLSSIPYILLILAFAIVLQDRTVFGIKLTGITTVYLAIGITSWVGICRLVRGEVIKHKQRDYVTAAKAFGCGNLYIIFRHILPNISHLIIINFSLRFMSFIHAEVILSFLGLGDKSGTSWGAMINDARVELARGVWWQMLAATLAIFFISLALNIFGDALRDCLDPKLRTE